jgi:hypothetical protein
MHEWQYTRTFRYHWVDTGHFYDSKDDNSRMEYYLEIRCCTPIQCYIDKKLGYDLHCKGKKVKHAKTVKELKEFAESL